MIQPHADELLRHFDEIMSMAMSAEGWAERESSDMFQSPHFSGGFDATECEFLFSYFPDEGGEFWFGVTLGDVAEAVRDRRLPAVELRLPE